MYEPVLSIDFGASYTKVARRSACNPRPGHPYDSRAEPVIIDQDILIPSLAIHTKQSRAPWLFGRQAAELTPDGKMEVFQNWKASLFHSQNNKDSAAAAIVAEQFFRWLKDKLETAGVDVQKFHTRVAMPAFKTFDEQALLIARCMDLAGWDSPRILKATEPHANLLGLFSEGRNFATHPPHDEILLDYRRMFGESSTYVRHARGSIFGTHERLLTVAVVDIGAFTTDIASLTFDFNSDDDMGDGLRYLRQESYVLGVINELDRPVFSALKSLHGINWAEVSFKETEIVKQSLYHGKPWSLLTKGQGTINLGGEQDQETVKVQAAHFADRLWKKVSDFFKPQKPKKVYLTGGGGLIPALAEPLAQHLSANGIIVAPLTYAGSVEQNLQRVATALGGASLILQAPGLRNDPEDGLPRRLPPIPDPLPDAYSGCSCQGGNKDCCFCGGRGYYSRK